MNTTYPKPTEDISTGSCSKIHVLHIVYSFGIGGLENGIVNLVNNMDPERFKVSIISLTPLLDSKQRIARDGVYCEVLEKRKGNDPSVPFRLGKLLKKYHVDVVHTHGWGTYLEGLFAARIARVPVVIHGEHGTDQLNWLRRRMAYRLGMVGTDKVLTVCENMRRRFIEKYHIPPEKISTIRNGVDTRAFQEDKELREQKRHELGFEAKDIVVGTIGRLCYEKNYETLLKAVARLAPKYNNFSLLIIGEGADRACLVDLATTLGIQNRVRFLGNRDDTLGLLNAMDIFVLTSRSEGLPNTLLEAMSVGVPVVTTNVGGIPEVITNTACGYLVDPNDPKTFAEMLDQLVGSAELRFYIGRAGRDHVLSQFSLGTMVAEYENTYTQLMNGELTNGNGVPHTIQSITQESNGKKEGFDTGAREKPPVKPSVLSDPYSIVVRNCVLPWVSVFTQSDFWKIYRDLSKDGKIFQAGSTEMLGKIKALVAHSYKHVPFYRERMDSLGIAPENVNTFVDLQKIPPTTKSDIVANFPDRCTGDPKVFSPWRYVSTSGTIERMTVIQDFRKRDFVRATQLLSLKIAADYAPGMRYMEIPRIFALTFVGRRIQLNPLF